MGTAAWENWRAFGDGAEELENADDELQSDCQFTGGPISFGPHNVSIIFRHAFNNPPIGPALVLTSSIHANLAPDLVVNGEIAPTDSTYYLGGSIGEEIGSLIALELGVRLRAAGTRRLSGRHETEGRERHDIALEVPLLATPGQGQPEQLTHLKGRPRNLSQLWRTRHYDRLANADQVQLARAARSYAHAVWWASEDPGRAWLDLVTSIEIAAERMHLSSMEPSVILQRYWPDMWAKICDAPDPLRTSLCRTLARQSRSTRKFIEFVTVYCPSPPLVRPPWSRLEWNRSSIRSAMAIIYDLRSKSLHGGQPFPYPMLDRPRPDGEGAFEERPSGITAGAAGGSWMHEEMPMLLSTFEFITRGALLSWWDDLINKSG